MWKGLRGSTEGTKNRDLSSEAVSTDHLCCVGDREHAQLLGDAAGADRVRGHPLQALLLPRGGVRRSAAGSHQDGGRPHLSTGHADDGRPGAAGLRADRVQEQHPPSLRGGRRGPPLQHVLQHVLRGRVCAYGGAAERAEEEGDDQVPIHTTTATTTTTDGATSLLLAV